VAVTLNVAELPATAAWDAGWAVMVGAVPTVSAAAREVTVPQLLATVAE